MAVYNGEQYICEAIESILTQEFDDFEFLIINDGSTDQSMEIISRYEKKDTRVRVIDNEYNIGLTRSLNFGIREARGEFVARQDADDASMPNRLSVQMEVFAKEHSATLVSSWCELIDGEGNSFGFVNPPKEKDAILQRFCMRDSPLPHGSVIFRKEPILQIGGYDERFWYAQDFDLWLRVLRDERNGVFVVPQTLYRLRKLPPEKSFKLTCQRRYAELALQQDRLGRRLDFPDVREWVAREFPGSLKPDRDCVGEYWLFLALTALCNYRRKLAWRYALRIFSPPSYHVWPRAIWRILLALVPKSTRIKIANLLVRFRSRSRCTTPQEVME